MLAKTQDKQQEIRAAVAHALLSYLRESPYEAAQDLALAAGVSPNKFSKLVNQKPDVRIRRDELERIAEAAELPATELLRAAGFVIDGDTSPLSERVAASLIGWEDWELEMLVTQLPGMRKSMRAAVDFLRTSGIGLLENPDVTGDISKVNQQTLQKHEISGQISAPSHIPPPDGERDTADTSGSEDVNAVTDKTRIAGQDDVAIDTGGREPSNPAPKPKK